MGGPQRDRFLRMNFAKWLLAEEFAYFAADQRSLRLTAHQNDVIDVAGRHLSVRADVFTNGERAFDERIPKWLDDRTLEFHIEGRGWGVADNEIGKTDRR